jgi:phosphopantetheinyl transferase (holo-ACP synthase)
MKLVGNDIVYLKAKNCLGRSQDSRFLNKVLHSSEHEILEKSAFKDHFLWLFWSVKESAYKCIKRAYPEFKFSPTKICPKNLSSDALNNYIATSRITNDCSHLKVPLQNTFTYDVLTPNATLFGQSVFSNNFVYTNVCANKSDLDRLNWCVKTIENPSYKSQSLAIREIFVADYLQENVSLKQYRAEIRKKQHSYPELYINSIKQPISISFTHDYIYLAYACLS